MRKKLSQAVARSTVTDARDIVIVDTQIPGFEFRVRRSGTKIWTYRYRNPVGRQRRYIMGRFPGVSATAARRLALTLAVEVANGCDVQEKKKAARAEGIRKREGTLRNFIEARYRAWALDQLKSGKYQLERIEADFRAWFDKPMTDLNAWLLEGWRQRQKEAGNQPVTINRAVQRLHALLARAVEWEVLEKHPFSGLKPLRHDKSGRVRYLTADEETQLREALLGREAKLREARDRFNAWRTARGRHALPRRAEEFVDYLRPVVLVALNTGLRRGEILQLEWKDVDLDGKWITVSGAIAKNGQTRRVPLNAEAVAILQAWRQFRSRRASAARVFPGSDGEGLQRIDKAWRSLIEIAGIENFRFHDLRHHFASRLVQSGIDLNTVRELLGHADITMVLRYAHMSPDRLAMAVERVARAAEPAPNPPTPQPPGSGADGASPTPP
jgi:integrase